MNILKFIKEKKIVILLSMLWILETLFFIRIIFIDSDYSDSYPCYFSIMSALLFSLFAIKNKSVHYEIGALVFTLIADTFLVLISPQNQLLGMVAFNVTQIFHMLFISKELNRNELKISIILRICLAIIGVILTIIVLKDGANALAILSIIYFSSLIMNIVYAFIKFKKIGLLAVALVFFILCDIFVGMSVLFNQFIAVDTNSFVYRFFNPSINVVWIFYIPSQTLIASNILLTKVKTNE